MTGESKTLTLIFERKGLGSGQKESIPKTVSFDVRKILIDGNPEF